MELSDEGLDGNRPLADFGISDDEHVVSATRIS